tara:strand:- start:2191 stop:3129 length:939 start_codon:yes stop_codon:yes gene_type:complete
MAFKIINREKQEVFIGSGQVYGAQSVQYNWQIPEAPLEFIGQSNSIIVPRGPQVGDFSLTAFVVDTDPFIKCIQSGGFNGFITDDRTDPDSFYSFYSGYLTSYNLSCSVDKLPEVAATFRVVGDMGQIPSGELPTGAAAELRYITGSTQTQPTGYGTKEGYRIGAPTSVEITMDDFETNLVSDFRLSMNIPRRDYYKIGRRSPFSVEIDYPVAATADFVIEVNGADVGYSGGTFRGYPCKAKLKNFDVKIKDYQTYDVITQFSFISGTLVGENYSADVDNNLKIQARYKVYIEDLLTEGNNLNTPQLVTITN